MSGALAGAGGAVCYPRVGCECLAAGRARVRLAAASFLAAYLLRGCERGVVRVCHRAVSIMARESVCWLVSASPPFCLFLTRVWFLARVCYDVGVAAIFTW